MRPRIAAGRTAFGRYLTPQGRQSTKRVRGGGGVVGGQRQGDGVLSPERSDMSRAWASIDAATVPGYASCDVVRHETAPRAAGWPGTVLTPMLEALGIALIVLVAAASPFALAWLVAMVWSGLWP
jgi:hypothetical protein